MITVRGLYKSFGKVEAVRGVSFEAEDGQITGLLGPNGAGKTTSTDWTRPAMPWLSSAPWVSFRTAVACIPA
jgi:ABC-type branched-subunit amino acid transport system ATPase component